MQCDLDIIGLAETHLRDDNVPFIEGFSAFTHNRKHLHRRARVGSGGVCLLIKSCLLEQFTVSILDSSVEDILWVEVKDKFTLKVLNICVCYLPPEGSSRHVDPHAFFDNLLSQIYIYQDIGPYLICGDFNARCSNEPDYIEGVDDIVERHVVDYKRTAMAIYL